MVGQPEKRGKIYLSVYSIARARSSGSSNTSLCATMGRALEQNATTMAVNLAFCRAILGWLLDFFLAYNILIGWFVVYLTECHVSLIFAWLVCMCDILFLANSLGKLSKELFQTLQRVLPFGSEKSKTKNPAAAKISQVGLLLHITSPLAFVPYHILFLLELDGPGLYAMICLLRLVWVARTQRVSISFFSADYTQKGTLRQAKQEQDEGTERNAD